MSGLTSSAIVHIAAAIRYWTSQNRTDFGRATPAFIMDMLRDDAIAHAWNAFADDLGIEGTAFFEPTEADAGTFVRWVFPELGL